MSSVRIQNEPGLYFNENSRFISPYTAYISVYPNPVTGILNLKWDSDYKGKGKLMIVDALGKVIKESVVNKEQLDYSRTINVRALRPGIYSVYIKTQDGKSYVRSFLKN